MKKRIYLNDDNQQFHLDWAGGVGRGGGDIG
jgi:hypothetical protein